MPDMSPLRPRLTPSQAERYRADGFLFPIEVFPPDEAAALRAEFEAFEAAWLTADLPLPLNTYKRVNAHVALPLAARMARDARVLDAVEAVLGPDILIYSAEFFVKEPRTRAIVSMHQDLTYWGLGAIDGLVTAWIALSPATRDSGAMDFVAGSHRNPILPHEDTHDPDNLLSRGQEVRVEVADEDKVTATLAPGQMSLHHGLMIHGSGPNTTDDRRIGFAIRYIRPDMRQEVGARDYAMPARGEDRFGNFIHIPPPQAPFAPEALALCEEIRKEQASVMMRGARGSSAGGIYA